MRTVDDVFADYVGRRRGIIKALTTEVRAAPTQWHSFVRTSSLARWGAAPGGPPCLCWGCCPLLCGRAAIGPKCVPSAP